MKKNKIEHIFIHRLTIPQKEKKEIFEKLIYYHTKAIKIKISSDK